MELNLAPVHFLSHGTTMLLGEDSRIRDYWKKLGVDALRHNVKGVIIMGAHWNTNGEHVQVAMNPQPTFMPLANTDREIWGDWKPKPDLKTGARVINMLSVAGIKAEGDPNFEWMIDTFPVIIGMFGDQSPPVTIVSQNSYFDPFYHIRIGQALRSLRREGYLLIGSGGGTHNLYRAEWKYMLKYKDNFAMERPPDEDSIEFRQSLEDVICRNGGGPELRRGLARLMKHPYFREAHGTDEHYVSACFVAGAVGEPEDRGSQAALGAEAWELCSSLNKAALQLLGCGSPAFQVDEKSRPASDMASLPDGNRAPAAESEAISVFRGAKLK